MAAKHLYSQTTFSHSLMVTGSDLVMPAWYFVDTNVSSLSDAITTAAVLHMP